MKFRPKEWKIWHDNQRLIAEEEARAKAAKQNKKAAAVSLKNPITDAITDDKLEEVNQVFANIDRKSSGHIKFSDLDLAMRNLGIEPHPYEIAEIEDRLRREEDPESKVHPKAKKSNIQLDDFTKIMVKKLTAMDSTSDADLGRAFTMLDRDGSGEIDKEEFTYILENLGCNFK